jgi:hypothetical protein
MKKVKFFLNHGQINKSIEILKEISETVLNSQEIEEYLSMLMNIYRLKKNPKVSELEHIEYVLKNRTKSNLCLYVILFNSIQRVESLLWSVLCF